MHEHFHAPKLRERGYQGSNQDIWKQWLGSKGFTGADAEMSWLASEGHTGSLNDRWMSLYRAAGLNGSIDDMGRSWTVPDGGLQPDPDTGP